MTILKTDTVSGIGTEGTVFEGNITFDSLNYMTLPKGTTTQSNRGRAVFFSGTISPTTTIVNTIDYIQIQTQGNAIDFGDMTHSYRRNASGVAASSTRGISAGGFSPSGSPSRVPTIQYVTIAITANAVDFGDLTISSSDNMGMSNDTRGVFAGAIDGSGNFQNNIDYITIATTGNAADFGDQTSEAYVTGQGCGSPTRGIVGGGFNNTPASTTNKDYIEYITFATTGNSTDFGNLTFARRLPHAASSATRGLWAGGEGAAPTNVVNIIDYVTIASTGNATDFGDSTVNGGGGGSSNGIRGVFGGGYGTHPGYGRLNLIEYVTIATTGNTKDFGDLTSIRSDTGCASDSHGGLTE